MRDKVENIILFAFSPILSLMLSVRNVYYNKYCVYLIGAFFSIFGAFLPPISDAYRYRYTYYHSCDYSISLQSLWTTERDFLYPLLSRMFCTAGIPFEYFRFLLLLGCYSLYCWMFLDIVKVNPAIKDNKKVFLLAVLALFISIRFFTLTTGIRFGVASTIVVVAVYMVYKRKFISACVLYMISMAMHFSMLVFAPFTIIAIMLSRVSIPSGVKYIIILVVLMTSQTAIGGIITALFPDNELVITKVAGYVEGNWGTASLLNHASVGGLAFTLVRILPVIPLTIIIYKRQQVDNFLANICFLLLLLLCVSFSSFSILLRYSNVTIAVLFVALLLTTTDSKRSLMDLKIALLSFIVMFASYAYSQRETLSRFEMHYRVILSPISLVGDYTYTDKWIQDNIDRDGEYRK